MAITFAIAFGAGVGGATGVGIVWIPAFFPFCYLVYLQIKEKFCPQQEVFHHCSNCGIKLAFYKDPVNDSCCFGYIPAKLWRSKTVEEDNFPNQELIFQYEQAHDVKDNIMNAKSNMTADFKKDDPNVMKR